MTLDERLVDLLVQAEEWQQQGRTFRISELCPDRPDLWAELEEMLTDMRRLDGVMRVPDSTPTVPGTDTAPAAHPLTIPGYEVLGEIGRGGMGVVYKVRDVRLQRIDALKVLAPHLAADARALRRFAREARAAAAIRDDHVVSIHAVKEDGPTPYLVMEFIAGINLDEHVRRDGALEVNEVVRIGMQAARGLAAAHGQGVIHRDVKPANVLLEEGTQRVKITDFGLARDTDDATITQSGVITGTPLYMSPEQARGETFDYRSDLFSLGSVLYTLCTGRQAFEAGTPLAVLKRVSEDEPRAIRELNPGVPPWLCAVVGKLLAKAPADRIQSAAEVAELLGQYLAHRERPDVVPPPPPVRGVRTRRPPRLLKSARVAAGVLLAACLGIAGYRALELRRAAPPAPPADGAAAPVVDGAPNGTDRDEPWLPPLVPEVETKRPSAFDARKREDIPAPLLALAGGGDPTRAPADLVAAFGDGRLQHEGQVEAMAFSDAAGALLAADGTGVLAWWDPATGQLLRRVAQAHDGPVRSLAVSPDGGRVATGGADRTAKLWDARTGRLLQTLTLPVEALSVAFSPDGEWLAVGSGGNKGPRQVGLYRADTGQPVNSFVASSHPLIHALAFSPDSRLLAVAGHDRPVRLFDSATGKGVRSWVAGAGAVQAVAFHPREPLLATGGTDGAVTLWDPRSGQMLSELPGHRGDVHRLTFSPDGKWLASADTQGGVKLWDVAARTERHALDDAASRGGLAFSRDSRTLATGGPNFSIRLWDVDTGQPRLPPDRLTGALTCVAFSSDGGSLAAAGAGRNVRLWDLAGWKPGEGQPPLRLLARHTDAVSSLAFSPDGKVLASGSLDNTIVLWDVASGKERHALTGHSNGLSRVVFSPNGQRLAAGGHDGRVLLWDVTTGEAAEPYRSHHGEVTAVAFSLDGRWLASAGDDKTVHLHALGDPQGHRTFHTDATLTHLIFNADGNWLGGVGEGSHVPVRLWNVATRLEVVNTVESLEVLDIALNEPARLGASGAADGTVRFWGLVQTRPQDRVRGPGPFGNAVGGVAFTPDGHYLATANSNGTVTVLHVPSPPPLYAPGAARPLPDPKELAGRPGPADALRRQDIPLELLSLAGGDKAPPELVAVLGDARFVIPGSGPGHGMAHSPDGKRLAVTQGPNVSIFDAASGRLLRTFRAFSASQAFQVAFSPDGKRIVASPVGPPPGEELKMAKVFDAESGKEVLALKGHTGRVVTSAFSPDGKRLVTASQDSTARVWNAGTGELVTTLSGHRSRVTSAVFSADGTRVASGATDGVVKVWDPEGGRTLHTLGRHKTAVFSLAFSPDGTRLATGSDDRWVVWDAATFEEVQSAAAPAGWLAFGSGGRTLLTAAHTQATPSANPVTRWDVATGKELARLPVPGARGEMCYLLGPDGATLFSREEPAGMAATVHAWDATTGQELHPHQGHRGQVLAVAVSPDGGQAASAGVDGTIRLWDLATGRLARTLIEPRHEPYTVAFRPDGKTLASGGNDGTILLWDVATGAVSRPLSAPGAEFTQVVFSADGALLAAAARDGVARV
jgi:WD40 repeat protein/tRNA A-37 threonylcarbamoyl transferase component Bud32